LIEDEKNYKLSQLFSSYKKLQMLCTSKELKIEEKKQIALAIKSIRKAIITIQKSES
jgi:hypothetical protein